MSGPDSSLFLTSGFRSEVADLTRAHQREKQIAVLTSMGAPFAIGLDGWPVVARAWVLKTLVAPEPKSRDRDEPDFSTLNQRTAQR